MKKYVFVLSFIFLIVCVFTATPAFSADTDFVIEDGVLLSYSGSSSNVTIPSSVTVIANNAFEKNTTLKSVSLGSSVLSIGNEAFYGCTALESISGGDNVNYVGALAFVDTKFLNNSSDEFLTIGGALVRYNGTSATVTLPDTIKTISPYAFLRNSKITSFKANKNLTSIGEGAFYECTSLALIDVTNYLSFVGADAFYGTKLMSTQNDFAVLGDGVLVSYNGSASAVIIPATVRSIAPNAFYENKNINSVTIPASVFLLGARAFMNCNNLSEVVLNNGLVMIDDEAFAQCTSLSSVSTPATLVKVGKGAFIKCSKLSTAFINGNNLSIDYGAFAHCTSLEAVLLSSDVSAIGSDAFSNDAELKAISIPPEVISVTADSFDNCDFVTVVTDEDSSADLALSSSCEVSYNRGDCGLDGVVDVIDATLVQRHMATISTLENKCLPFADADFDGSISVLDATYIQRYVAGLI